MNFLRLSLAVAVCLHLLAALQSCKSCNKTSKNDLKIFRYNQSSGIASLDPAFSKDQSTTWACNHLYNSLLQLDNDLNLQPAIAKSWDISPDGKTYTFHLRDEVKFHNDSCFKNGIGRTVTADDFVYSLSRIIDPKVASPGAWIFNTHVDTTQPFAALNDSTFVLRLAKPFLPMLGILTMQYCSVIPHEAIAKYGNSFRSHPVGTGPFLFKTWKEGTALILTKNPDYFENDEQGKQLPYLDGIKISFIDNKKSEYLSFKQHELDFINSIDASYIDEVLDESGELKQELASLFDMAKSPYLNTEYLGFLTTNTQSPLYDKNIRQAINYGFNRVEMLKYLRNSVGKPAESGFTPFGLPSYNASEVQGYHYNPSKALELIAKAGYGNGKKIPQIKLYTNETYKEYALYISKELEKIGFNITVEVNQPSMLREWMSQGKADFFRGSWLADYPDAENYFAVFYSKNGAPPNYTRFSNLQFDNLYERSLQEVNDSVRYAMYHQMERIIIDVAPVVPLFYDEVLRFTQKNVKGLSANGLNLLSLKYADIQ